MNSNPTTIPTIKMLRLITGDDIVSEYEIVGSEIKLRNPMKLLIEAHIDTQSQTIFMFNWIPHGISRNNECIISTNHVLFTTTVEEDIEEHYLALSFEIFEDAARAKIKKTPKSNTEYMDSDKKIISFKNKDNKIS